MTAPEALRWAADQCDVKVAEVRMNDWVGVLIKSNVRSRIETLLETASMCRAKAKLLEEGFDFVDVPKRKP